MNQTRILLGVCLALLAVAALLFYQQQKSMDGQRDQMDKTQKLLLDLASNRQSAAPAITPAPPPVAVLPPVAPGPDAVQPASAAEKERLAAIKRELDASKAEVEALKGEKTEFYDEMQRLKLEAEARLSVVRSAPMLAKVTAVVPEQRLVVIGAGSANNIAPGEEFSVRRDGRILAKIKISESIDPSEAAACVIAGTLIHGEDVKAGDEVVKLD